MFKKLTLSGIFFSFLVVCTLIYFLKFDPYKGISSHFEIHRGESFFSVNKRLWKKNIIKYPQLFYRFMKWQQLERSIRAGLYQISPGQTLSDLAYLFTKGPQVVVKVTIPEGKNIYEIADIFEQKRIVKSDLFIAKCKNPVFIKMLGINAPSVEGYLYPDTYKFAPYAGSELVIKTMVNRFNDITKETDFKNKLNLNKDEVITLASIVEKETGASFERPLIAQVFLNRLARHMRLQSDPTTIYGLFPNFHGNLTKKHLLQKTSYNTYKINGLPVGPIANPGISSIDAVLNSPGHNFLYFVSKNDGTHMFSKNYKEHLKAVRKYQLTRVNRKGKSWRDLSKKKQDQN